MGTYDAMIENIAGFYSGYVQVHEEGYWDDQSVDNSFASNSEILGQIKAHENVSVVVPRLENFALLSGLGQTKGGMIIGTDPETENQLTGLAGRIKEGSYFNSSEKSILLAKDLAKSLGLSVGDTVVVLGQGYHAMSAAEKYRICGIVSFGSPELNKRLAYIPLNFAQELFSCEGNITSLVLGLHNKSKSALVASDLQKSLGEEYEVMNWAQMMPELKQALEADNSGSYMFIGILYLIITFGIFGTVLMMIAERRYEFGVLAAIGYKRSKLSIMVVLETLLLSLGGTIIGMLIAIPLVYYFYVNPIQLTGGMADAYIEFGFEPVMKFSMQPSIFLWQALVVFIMAAFVCTYPLIKLQSFNSLEAMRA